MTDSKTGTPIELKPGQISREQYAEIGELFAQTEQHDAIIRACIGDRMVNGKPELTLFLKGSELELSQHMKDAAFKAIAEVADEERETVLTMIRAVIPDWK